MTLRISTANGGASLSRTTLSNSTSPSSSLSPNLPIRHLPATLPFTFSTKTTRPSLQLVQAKKFTSRTGRFDSKNRRSKTAIKEQEDKEEDDEGGEDGEIIERVGPESSVLESSRNDVSSDVELPELPGDKPDFWEGPQWDALGFVVQYLWAIGIVFALIACGIAVATYNEGATDFKETPAYKESVQSQELLEAPDANSDVFESNPTEVAPSLE